MSASDPRPWLEEGASGELKSLLDSAKLDEPSSDQLASLAKKMGPLLLVAAAVVAPAAAGGAGAGAAAAGKTAAVVATAAKTGLAVKVIVTVAAVAAVGGGAFQAGRVYEDKVAPPKMIERPVIVVAPPAPAPAPAPVLVEPEPEPVVPEPIAAKPKPAPTPMAEAALLEQAMTALKAQDWAKALALCDRHAREAGAKGLLIQEREVIAIEALVRLGRTAEAKARAEKFKKAFPTSTHLLKVESLAGE